MEVAGDFWSDRALTNSAAPSPFQAIGLRRALTTTSSKLCCGLSTIRVRLNERTPTRLTMDLSSFIRVTVDDDVVGDHVPGRTARPILCGVRPERLFDGEDVPFAGDTFE